MANPRCIGCGKSPTEIEEYVHNPEEDPDPIRFVRENEGTYNRENGHFLCTECYIARERRDLLAALVMVAGVFAWWSVVYLIGHFLL